MGQYYTIANIDKKEMLDPHDFDNGRKLMEWSYDRNNMVRALMNLLEEKWKGDRVFAIGDYATDNDKAEPCYGAVRNLIDELGIRNETNEDERPIFVYEYVYENFNNISSDVDISDNGYRYIYNHELKKYIDLEHCPIEWAWYNPETDKYGVTRVSPLPLLITMGNARGGGDYCRGCNGFVHVGSWCDSVRSLEITKDPLNVDYEEFAPDFTLETPMIPYTEKDRMIREEMERNEREMI